MDKTLLVIPAARVGCRLQLAAVFPPSSRRGRSGSACSSPALMADVRVVIRRHFPVSPGDRRIVEKVSEDIALKRRSSRKLRCSDRVERALATDVLPLVKHPFDRRALVAAGKKICSYVSGACADERLAVGGVQILVVLDTFACPTLLRRLPCQKIPIAGLVMKGNPCMEMELGSASVPAEKVRRPVGTIGDGRPNLVEERFQGWLPW